ncbi:MAG: hypothetical protein ABFR53_12245, partial [Actinomycetota bacterium]
MELNVSSPFLYAVGFESVLDPASALREMSVLPGDWSHAGPASIEELPSRIEHRFEDVGATGAMVPGTLAEFVADGGNPIRYVVPVYRSEEFGSAEFTPVPNHVVVTAHDASVFDMVDDAASEQSFFPLLHRGATIGDRFRRVYSSLISEPVERPSEEFQGYMGEPGPALWLIEHLASMDIDPDVGLVAEPDWYVSYPNDLATGATRSIDSPT